MKSDRAAARPGATSATVRAARSASLPIRTAIPRSASSPSNGPGWMSDQPRLGASNSRPESTDTTPGSARPAPTKRTLLGTPASTASPRPASRCRVSRGSCTEKSSTSICSEMTRPRRSMTRAAR